MRSNRHERSTQGVDSSGSGRYPSTAEGYEYDWAGTWPSGSGGGQPPAGGPTIDTFTWDQGTKEFTLNITSEDATVTVDWEGQIANGTATADSGTFDADTGNEVFNAELSDATTTQVEITVTDTNGSDTATATGITVEAPPVGQVTFNTTVTPPQP